MVRRSKKRRRNVVSSIELLVQGWLTEAEIPYATQYAIGLCHVDIFIAPKLVIEIQGCYWHNCPECNPGKTVQNRRANGKDKKRVAFLLNAGYQVLLLWEHELTEENKAKVMAKIRRKAGIRA
jgi:G:T-mismatch repair DNA endonuclease (very short patch repair protein)